MEPQYNHQKYETKIYEKWEKSGAFKKSGEKKPYTILMPPPNCNASLHAGHAMYTVDDILVRFKRMQGFSALWIPGMDHAGFETQFVYEKQLAKEGKSRMDYDRKTLYKNIYEFVQKNSGLIFEQFKRLGFSADWTRTTNTWDPEVVNNVYDTFKKMESEGLVYRDNYIVNYCVHDGTSLAELEVKHIERTDPLYYIKYGPFTLATVRPETKFGDTAVAVNPNDSRYKKWVGKEIEVNGLLSKFKLKVIADELVDPNFGTGVVKVTPAHDPNDFIMGKRHGLEVKKVIDIRGRLTEIAGPYAGMKVKEAREKIVEDLKNKGLLEKVDENYVHSVTVCYKCGHDLEPTIIPNWFIKVDALKAAVKKVVEEDKVKFYPKRFKKHMLSWLDVMHDWPISRQIVWCIRIPVWYKVDRDSDINVTFIDKSGQKKFGNINEFDFKEVKVGLQSVVAAPGSKYVVSENEPTDGEYIPETDTFDTWFSSGQWPIVTLKTEEFKTRFPTDVMGTLSDILKFWISRMILFSLYLKKEIPYKDVYLWSMVADSKGVKMSKSKGNVINPIELIDKYGADALRFSLLYGTPAGSKVILSEQKVSGMRKFANKVWNAGRFVKDFQNDVKDDELFTKFYQVEFPKMITGFLDRYELNKVSESLYETIWHDFCDIGIEKAKKGEISSKQLKNAYETLIKLLHPFMPFVTEQIWSELGEKELLITSRWPTT